MVAGSRGRERGAVGAVDHRATVGRGTSVAGSIVGEGAELGADCDVRGLVVIGPGAKVGDGNMLDHGMRVAADETIAGGAVSFS